MRALLLLMVAVMARVLPAQSADSTRAPVAPVSGVVHDSLAGTRLVGAVVQLVDADSPRRFSRSTLSDSTGQFTIADVPAGRYTIGFLHPVLDSLGLQPIMRDVVANGRQTARVDLGVPSPTRLRTLICGPPPAKDSGAVIIGVIRNALDGSPASGATVAAEWLEIDFTPQGLSHRVPRLVATTAENGWFAMCNVPNAGTLAIMASRGTDSTDIIEVRVPADRFLRRELYLGTPRVGTGRLTGSAVTAADGRPLSGAQVSVRDGPQTRANESGEWTLVGAPLGTRMLEIRAVGYYPDRRVVDVVSGTPPIRAELSTMKAVLDTMRISASRLDDMNLREFNERRRSGAGRYVTSEEIARKRPFVTSDIFNTMAGLRLERAGEFRELTFRMRSSGGDPCTPAIYVNGLHLDQLSAEGLNDWVNPEEIVGIEVYSGPGIPPQFNRGMRSTCGSIVVWTKVLPGQRRTAKDIYKALGFMAAGVLIGVLMGRSR